jgi:hypothetical protein
LSPKPEPLELVRLDRLMERSRGKPAIVIGLIDGPVAVNHPGLADGRIRAVSGKPSGSCARLGSAACQHGTFVAGILAAKRGSEAPAICPECTLILRPIFGEAGAGNEPMPSTTRGELARAIVDVTDEFPFLVSKLSPFFDR